MCVSLAPSDWCNFRGKMNRALFLMRLVQNGCSSFCKYFGLLCYLYKLGLIKHVGYIKD